MTVSLTKLVSILAILGCVNASIGFQLRAGSASTDEQSQCPSYSTSDTCDADSTCTWCKSGAVPSACYETSVAQHLPAAVFECDKHETSVEAGCRYQTADSCDANPDCTWCTGKGLGTCYEMTIAQRLPTSVFDCDNLSTALYAATCPSYSTQSDCNADDACTWCQSGAVPSSCYAIETAQHLPSPVFICDKNSFELKADSCPSYSDSAACDADSACTWCKSGAVPSACYAKETAEHLPSPVFICDNSTYEEVVFCPHISDQNRCDAQEWCVWCTGIDETTQDKTGCWDWQSARYLHTATKYWKCSPTEPVELMADSCPSYSDSAACDADSACTWCKSGAVPSACYAKETAQHLPSPVFICDANTYELEFKNCHYTHQAPCDADPECAWCIGVDETSKSSTGCWDNLDASYMDNYPEYFKCGPSELMADSCPSYSDSTACDADSACTWCKSGAVPSACYAKETATHLPSPVFICDANTYELEADSCPSYSDSTACDADSACTWCKSGAVPSACYAKETATHLPSPVFICDANTYEVEADSCPSYSDSTACDADSACTWCKSGAVPSACYAKETATHLPSPVFICDANTYELEADSCPSYSDSTACDADSACTWCKSGAVPSACYAKETATHLPSPVFICDANTYEVEGDSCPSYSDSTACDADSACTWCKSGAVPSSCYAVETAQHLPSPVFICDKNAYELEADKCPTYSDSASCDADATCTWCKSGAVPSSCYAVETAQHLPSPVFICDKNANTVEADSCPSFSDQNSCNAASECTWCKSGAVPSSCYAVETAQHLPSPVFICDKKEIEQFYS